MLKELSIYKLNVLFLSSASLPVKGKENAKTRNIMSNTRKRRISQFLMLRAFFESSLISFSKSTLEKYTFLNFRKLNRCKTMGAVTKSKAHKNEGYRKEMVNLVFYIVKYNFFF